LRKDRRPNGGLERTLNVILGSHTLSSSRRFSGNTLRIRKVWAFSRSPVQHGSYDDSTGALTFLQGGLRTTASEERSSVRIPTGTDVRSHRREFVSRVWDRVFLCVIPDVFYFSFPLFRMETNNKQKTLKTAAPAANGPIKVFLIDDISSSVFAREVPTKAGQRTFYSVSFSRSFVDSKGVRQYVKTFDREDLGKVAQVAQQADEYVRQLAA
jgi:hypothetical protein